jgi:hypothetical protein
MSTAAVAAALFIAAWCCSPTVSQLQRAAAVAGAAACAAAFSSALLTPALRVRPAPTTADAAEATATAHFMNLYVIALLCCPAAAAAAAQEGWVIKVILRGCSARCVSAYALQAAAAALLALAALSNWDQFPTALALGSSSDTRARA